MRIRRKIISLASAFVLLANSVSVVAQGTSQERTQQKTESRVTIVAPGQGGGTVVSSGQEVRVALSPGNEVVFGQSGDGSNYSFVSSEMRFDTRLVKGAPYSAEAVTETIQTLGDGNRIVRRSTASVARDSQGRTRHEQTLNAVGPWSSSGEGVTTIFINDPVSGVNYVLDPRTRTARKMAFARLSPARGGSFGGGFGGGVAAGATTARAEYGRAAAGQSIQRVSGGVLQGNAIKKVQPPYPPVAKAAHAQGAVQVEVTVNEAGDVASASAVSGHPLLRQAALDAAQQWRFKPTEINGSPVKVQGLITFNFTLEGSEANETGVQERRSAFGAVSAQPKTESLGKEMVEGVQAEGTRTTITIPAGAIGNEWPIDIIEERWYSPELQTTVKTRHHDPRTGENTFRLTNINRSEPSASLFEVPSDYTVKDDPASFARERMLELEKKMRKPENE